MSSVPAKGSLTASQAGPATKKPRTSPPINEHIDAEPPRLSPTEPGAVDTVGEQGPTREPERGGRPITELFEPWDPPAHLVALPAVVEDTWGIVPYPGPEGPQSRPNSPSARESNAQTNPPLWEDRKHHFKSGRYQKYVGPCPPEDYDSDDSDNPGVDQEDGLILRLIEMRPIRAGPNKGQPARQPVVWFYKNGKPKDWTEMKRTMHALNQRRREIIRDITRDPPWTRLERECLARLFKEHPGASITELAERHNYAFKGNFRNDIHASEDVAYHQFGEELSEGRTIESFRHEYLTWKAVYDAGNYPEPARESRHRMPNPRFRPTIDAFERDWDPEEDKEDPNYCKPKKGTIQQKATRSLRAKVRREERLGPAVPKVRKTPQKPKIPRKQELSDEYVVDSSDEDQEVIQAVRQTNDEAVREAIRRASQPAIPKLTEAQVQLFQQAYAQRSHYLEHISPTTRSSSANWEVEEGEIVEDQSTAVQPPTETRPAFRAARSIDEESYGVADESSSDSNDEGDA